MSLLSHLSAWSYFKPAVTAVLCFIAVIAGIFAGNSIFGARSERESLSNPKNSDIPRMYLASGDLFPLESYTDEQGNKGNFGDLLKGSDAIVYFAQPQCQPCIELLKFRRHNIAYRLAPGVKEIVLIPNSYKKVPEEFAGNFEGTTVVFYDREYWEKQYHQVFWPTMVGVDNSGFITHIQYGYENAIDFELVERFMTSAG